MSRAVVLQEAQFGVGEAQVALNILTGVNFRNDLTGTCLTGKPLAKGWGGNGAVLGML